MKTSIYLIFSLSLILFPNIVLAADSSSSKNNKKDFYQCLRSDPSEPKKYCTSLPETRGNQPVKVQISIHLLDILDVDQSEHTWTVRSFLYASWKDQRLKYKIRDFDRLSKLVYRGDLANDQMLRMWHPNLTIPNQIEQRETENIEISISKFGIVHYKEVFVAKVRTNFNFRTFPFDKQTVSIEIEPFSETQKKVRLVPAVKKNGNTSIPPDLWNAGEFNVSFSDRPGARNQLSKETGLWLSPDGSQNFSLMTFSLELKRDYFNFLTTKLLVLYFFAFILWLNAGFASEEGSHKWPWELFLGIIFFSLEAQSMLPALPYITLYNVFVNLLYVYVLTDFVLWLVTERMRERKKSIVLMQRIKILGVGPSFLILSWAIIYWFIEYV